MAQLDADLGSTAPAGSATTIALTTTATARPGNLIIVSLAWFGAARTITSVTDGVNTYTIGDTSSSSGGGEMCGIAYCENSAGLASGSTITATISGAAVSARIITAVSFSGVITASSVDQHAANHTAGVITAWTAGPITTTNANDLIFGLFRWGAAGTNNPNNSPTAPATEVHDINNGLDCAIFTEYKIVSATGSQSVSGTASIGTGSGSSAAICYAFKLETVVQGTTTSSTSMSSTSSSISSTSSSTSSTSTSVSTTSVSTSSTSSSISTSSTSSSISSTSSSISSTSSSSTSASTSISSTSSSISSTSMSSTSLSSTSSSSSISSTSSSFSSTSSSVSSTSASTSSTSFSSTSSSSSTSTTTIPANLFDTYQDTLTLPTSSAADIDADSNKNVQNVAVDDGDYFIQYGSEYMLQEYKNKWTNNTDTPSFTFKGRSTYDTRVSPFLVQIYNQNLAAWETLAVVNTQPADIDFTVRVSQTTNVANYYDSNNIVTFRVYQQVI